MRKRSLVKQNYSPLIVGEAHVFTVKVEFSGCWTGHVPCPQEKKNTYINFI